ncbi:hypothetical protein [Escherichia coli]|uniref:hypothetical protein n=1 Tax=Escherichia coli TaxID=562 RepID=UPI0016808574|nr:hypothetical protein [Escherichia coli]
MSSFTREYAKTRWWRWGKSGGQRIEENRLVIAGDAARFEAAKAQELGIEVIDEAEMMSLLGA